MNMEIKTEGRSGEELLNNPLELAHSDMGWNSGQRAADTCMDACSSPCNALTKLPVFITVPSIISSLLKFPVALLYSSDKSKFSFFFFSFLFKSQSPNFPLGKNKKNLPVLLIVFRLIFLDCCFPPSVNKYMNSQASSWKAGEFVASLLKVFCPMDLSTLFSSHSFSWYSLSSQSWRQIENLRNISRMGDSSSMKILEN